MMTQIEHKQLGHYIRTHKKKLTGEGTTKFPPLNLHAPILGDIQIWF